MLLHRVARELRDEKKKEKRKKKNWNCREYCKNRYNIVNPIETSRYASNGDSLPYLYVVAFVISLDNK